MLPIPYHLRFLAEEIICKETTLTMQLHCPCGCTYFKLYENAPTAAEREELNAYQAECNRLLGMHGIYGQCNKSGSIRTYQRGFLGIEKDIQLPPAPPYAAIHAIKASCAECGKETVLFDSRLHGYDSAVCGTNCAIEYAVAYRQKFLRNQPERRVRITTTCDIPHQELTAMLGECASESSAMALWSECFTSIIISTEFRGKYQKMLGFETA